MNYVQFANYMDCVNFVNYLGDMSCCVIHACCVNVVDIYMCVEMVGKKCWKIEKKSYRGLSCQRRWRGNNKQPH